MNTIFEIPNFNKDNGSLVVLQQMETVPFNIERVFTVIANKGDIRGEHAHKKCSQFLTCPSGIIKVKCFDGKQEYSFLLDRPSLGILIKPGIWSQQIYLKENSVLNVFCDLKFNEEDYIRDFNQFIEFKNKLDN